MIAFSKHSVPKKIKNIFSEILKTGWFTHGKYTEDFENEFKKLLQPVLDKKIFPNQLQILIQHHMKNPKSSFSYDSHLEMELNKYDNNIKDYTYLEEVEIGNVFRNNDKFYKKIEKRRKRYLCIEKDSGRKYLFLPHAKVELI